MASVTGKTFAAVCCIYDDLLWLPYAARAIYEPCDRIFFLVSDRPWNGPVVDNNATLRAIAALADPQKKISVIKGNWSAEPEQRNFGLELLRQEKIDYCFIFDADEIYDPRYLRNMMDFAAFQPEVGCWHMRWITYWKSARYRIDPLEPYCPPVFVRADAGSFIETRNPKAEPHSLIPPEIGLCHHMSYARTDEDIRRKLSTFSHSHQLLSGWFEQVWKAWDSNHDLQNLHPVNPAEYARAIVQNPDILPPVLKELYQSNPDYPQTLSSEKP